MSIVQQPEQSRLAQWAVGTASAAIGLVVTDVLALGAYVLFQGSIDDTWVGAIGMLVMFAGVLTAFVAFALGLAARIRHDPWAGLRLPVSVFPTLVVLIALGELLWWE